MSRWRWYSVIKMAPSLLPLFCDSSVSVKENLDKKKFLLQLKLQISFVPANLWWRAGVDKVFLNPTCHLCLIGNCNFFSQIIMSDTFSFFLAIMQLLAQFIYLWLCSFRLLHQVLFWTMGSSFVANFDLKPIPGLYVLYSKTFGFS